MKNGYIKLWRSMVDWEWYRDTNTKCVFLHLLLLANHADAKWQGNTIKSGQLITSSISISDATGISRQSVRTALDHLKSTNEITIKSTNKFILVTLVNWESYQLICDEPTNKLTTKPTINQPSTNHQLTTNKKNKNKENNNYYVEQVIEHLNQVAGTKYKPTSDSTIRVVTNRLSEGYVIDDFKSVIDFKCSEWLDDPHYCKYLRPETLFGNKFEGYLSASAMGNKSMGKSNDQFIN